MSEEERQGEERNEAPETHAAGMPGGGVGRRDEVGGRTGVYPWTEVTDEQEDQLPTRTAAEWGQGLAGPAGYEDSGTSELSPPFPGPPPEAPPPAAPPPVDEAPPLDDDITD